MKETCYFYNLVKSKNLIYIISTKVPNISQKFKMTC